MRPCFKYPGAKIAAAALCMSIAFALPPTTSAQPADPEDPPRFATIYLDLCGDRDPCPGAPGAAREAAKTVVEELRKLLPDITEVRDKEGVANMGAFKRVQNLWENEADGDETPTAKKESFNRLIYVTPLSGRGGNESVELKGWKIDEDFSRKTKFRDLGTGAWTPKTFDLEGGVIKAERIKRFLHNMHRENYEFFGTKRVNLGCLTIPRGENNVDQIKLLRSLAIQLKMVASKDWKNEENFLAAAREEGLSGYSFFASNLTQIGGECEDKTPLNKLPTSDDDDHYLLVGTLEIVTGGETEEGFLPVSVAVKIGDKNHTLPRPLDPIRFNIPVETDSIYGQQISIICGGIVDKWSPATANENAGSEEIVIACKFQN